MENQIKKVFIFDLDGTLTESKSALEKDMSDVLCGILSKGNIMAIIGGGKFGQFEKQFLSNFSCPSENLVNLYLLPTSGARLYSWNKESGDWGEEYSLSLTDSEKKKIFDAFEKISGEVSFEIPEPVAGVQIEDRGTQITFSAFGQESPINIREKWDPDNKKRQKMVEKLNIYIPEFEIRIGGMTSIDVTQKGIDKKYGVNKFFEYTKANKNESIFFGDALFEGGNDYPVTKTGIDTVQISGPKDTIQKLQKYLEPVQDLIDSNL